MLRDRSQRLAVALCVEPAKARYLATLDDDIVDARACEAVKELGFPVAEEIALLLSQNELLLKWFPTPDTAHERREELRICVERASASGACGIRIDWGIERLELRDYGLPFAFKATPDRSRSTSFGSPSSPKLDHSDQSKAVGFGFVPRQVVKAQVSDLHATIQPMESHRRSQAPTPGTSYTNQTSFTLSESLRLFASTGSSKTAGSSHPSLSHAAAVHSFLQPPPTAPRAMLPAAASGTETARRLLSQDPKESFSAAAHDAPALPRSRGMVGSTGLRSCIRSASSCMSNSGDRRDSLRNTRTPSSEHSRSPELRPFPTEFQLLGSNTFIPPTGHPSSVSLAVVEGEIATPISERPIPDLSTDAASRKRGRSLSNDQFSTDEDARSAPQKRQCTGSASGCGSSATSEARTLEAKGFIPTGVGGSSAPAPRVLPRSKHRRPILAHLQETMEGDCAAKRGIEDAREATAQVKVTQDGVADALAAERSAHQAAKEAFDAECVARTQAEATCAQAEAARAEADAARAAAQEELAQAIAGRARAEQACIYAEESRQALASECDKLRVQLETDREGAAVLERTLANERKRTAILDGSLSKERDRVEALESALKQELGHVTSLEAAVKAALGHVKLPEDADATQRATFAKDIATARAQANDTLAVERAARLRAEAAQALADNARAQADAALAAALEDGSAAKNARVQAEEALAGAECSREAVAVECGQLRVSAETNHARAEALGNALADARARNISLHGMCRTLQGGVPMLQDLLAKQRACTASLQCTVEQEVKRASSLSAALKMAHDDLKASKKMEAATRAEADAEVGKARWLAQELNSMCEANTRTWTAKCTALEEQLSSLRVQLHVVKADLQHARLAQEQSASWEAKRASFKKPPPTFDADLNALCVKHDDLCQTAVVTEGAHHHLDTNKTALEAQLVCVRGDLAAVRKAIPAKHPICANKNGQATADHAQAQDALNDVMQRADMVERRVGREQEQHLTDVRSEFELRAGDSKSAPLACVHALSLPTISMVPAVLELIQNVARMSEDVMAAPLDV